MNKVKVLYDLGVGEMPIVGVRFMTMGVNAVLAYEYDYDAPQSELDNNQSGKWNEDYNPTAISIIYFKGVSVYCHMPESLLTSSVPYNKLIEIENSTWIAQLKSISKEYGTDWLGGRHFRVVISDEGSVFDIIAKEVSRPIPGIPPSYDPNWDEFKLINNCMPKTPYDI